MTRERLTPSEDVFRVLRHARPHALSAQEKRLIVHLTPHEQERLLIHVATYTVSLAATSRLLLREEQILGRANEKPGRLASRIRVHHAGRLLLDQHTAYGDPAPGWDGPAVLDGHRAVGQLLVVDPELDGRHPPVLLGGRAKDGCAVLAPLAGGPALLATAVARTSSALRELLDEALGHALGQ